MANTVNVAIDGGPQLDVAWSNGMNAQDALERAYAALNDPKQFTYALKYFGPGFGYLVVMINETYESFFSAAHPFFYWEFYLNDTPSQTGIDSTILNDGDRIRFALEIYNPAVHNSTTVGQKHDVNLSAVSRP
ncbi:MAG: hypothetical protein JWM26_4478 [Betaproteobacteria bacterium]|nr:hypothetical protein [Betaproteobacteria bacterium]